MGKAWMASLAVAGSRWPSAGIGAGNKTRLIAAWGGVGERGSFQLQFRVVNTRCPAAGTVGTAGTAYLPLPGAHMRGFSGPRRGGLA